MTTALHAEDTVALLCWASDDYNAKRTVDGVLTPQTYVFMEGRFSEGWVVDSSLQKFKFEDVVKKLAVDLRQQSFFPAGTVKEADLLLVVHRGVTARMDRDFELHARDADRNRQIAAASTEAHANDATAESLVNSQSASLDADLAFDTLIANQDSIDAEFRTQSVAATLGISNEIRRTQRAMVDTEYARGLRAMLNEDRYFVVVIAYDAHELRKTKQLKRAWTAHLSLRSAGVNFATAFDRMSSMGGTIFGMSNDGIQMKRAPDRKAVVEVGPVIVVDSTVKP